MHIRIPRHVYKMRPLESEEQQNWLKETLLENKFYWSSASQFNDPFELQPNYLPPQGIEAETYARHFVNLVNPYLTSFGRNWGAQKMLQCFEPDTWSSFQKERREKIDNVAIYSLTEDPCNILMWAHYSSAHKGVCLIFDGKSLIKNFSNLTQVKYSSKRPSIQMGPGLHERHIEIGEKYFLTKANDWAYEKEWRIIDDQKGAGYREFSSNCLVGLIFGAKICPDDKKMVEEWGRQRETPLQLFQAECDSGEYKVNVLQISN